jgi:methionyl aminopeptidase
MDNEILQKYLKAGRIAKEVREHSKTIVKPGTTVLDICETLETKIREMGGEPAFPVNVSLNDVAAHYTAGKNDTSVIKKSDVVKVDIGVHVDGYVGDTAYTVCFDDEHVKLIKASERALEEAIKLCKPGTLLRDISEKIEKTIKGFGFNPVANLTGHGLTRFDLHAEPQIPNVKVMTDYKLSEDQVIALEPFATNGSGWVKESEPTLIFKLLERRPVRNQDARRVIRFAERFNGLPFAERWIPLDSLIKIRLALRELRARNVIYDYPVLKEKENGIIAQAEHTIIVKDEPVVTTK